jgi:cytochrome c oxidase cbb3-type subunit I/II
MRTAQLIALSSLLLASAARADEPGRIEYDRYCAWCHGQNGDGRGLGAHRFPLPPRDFTTAAFKCRTTSTGSLPTDDDLRHSIRDGLHGTGMPSWRVLSGRQVENLIAFIKHFSSRWTSEPVPAPLVAPPEPPATAESVQRGANLWARFKCATCHGDHGQGAGVAAANLHDDAGNTMRAADLTKKGSLRCGDSASRIYTTFMTGLNGTPMPSFESVVKPDEAWDLVHFVQSLQRANAEGPASSSHEAH